MLGFTENVNLQKVFRWTFENYSTYRELGTKLFDVVIKCLIYTSYV